MESKTYSKEFKQKYLVDNETHCLIQFYNIKIVVETIDNLICDVVVEGMISLETVLRYRKVVALFSEFKIPKINEGIKTEFKLILEGTFSLTSALDDAMVDLKSDNPIDLFSKVEEITALPVFLKTDYYELESFQVVETILEELEKDWDWQWEWFFVDKK